jgi:hypothetical protein
MIALLAFSAGLIAGAVIVWQHGGPQPASNTLRPASNSVDAAKPKSSAVRAPNAAIGVRPAARLLSDETEVDFGVLPEGELVEHAFVLKNVSGAPLKIVGVRASCSCAIADVETDALAPGQSTEL